MDDGKQFIRELILALEDVLEQHNPFMTDSAGCECGENASGFDDDGKPCCHIRAARAIENAREHM